jgi:hypothetical protein
MQLVQVVPGSNITEPTDADISSDFRKVINSCQSSSGGNTQFLPSIKYPDGGPDPNTLATNMECPPSFRSWILDEKIRIYYILKYISQSELSKVSLSLEITNVLGNRNRDLSEPEQLELITGVVDSINASTPGKEMQPYSRRDKLDEKLNTQNGSLSFITDNDRIVRARLKRHRCLGSEYLVWSNTEHFDREVNSDRRLDYYVDIVNN